MKTKARRALPPRIPTALKLVLIIETGLIILLASIIFGAILFRWTE